MALKECGTLSLPSTGENRVIAPYPLVKATTNRSCSWGTTSTGQTCQLPDDLEMDASDPEVENGSPNHAAPRASRRSKDAPGDALGNAIGRAWTRKVEEILGSPDMMRGEEFGRLLGVTPQAVGKWRRQGLVLGLQSLTRTFRYPKWQITDDGKLLPGLKEVTGELGEPWTVYRSFCRTIPG